MTFEIALLLAILGLAVAMFALEWVPSDVVALGTMLALTMTGLLSAKDAFAGFGSDTVLMILGLLILTAALWRTGVVDLSGRLLLRHVGNNVNRMLLTIMLASALLGAFMSNTASTAFFLPIVLGLARRMGASPARLLMPLAFSSILTSSVTLISTSTNIVVSGLMVRAGLKPMGMFELAPVGIPIAVAGLLYMWTIGRRLIPDRTPAKEANDDFGLRPYLTEIVILPDSSLIGKTLAESSLGRDLDLTVLEIVRNKDQYLMPTADTVLQADDLLLVEGERQEILKIKDTTGIDIKSDVKLWAPETQTGDIRFVEVILLPGSPLLGQTLKRAHFRERYGLQVLAINRHGQTISKKISQVRLQTGDLLLVQGRPSNITAVEEEHIFRVLGAVEEERSKLGRAPLAIGIFVAVLVLASFKILPIAVAVLLGGFLVLVTRCLTPEEAYREVEWKALILIGSMLAVGAAMEQTGTAKFLAAQIVDLAGTANPTWLLTGFFFLTVVLTQPMSNQAAAVVVLPVAIQTAVTLGLNPRTFAMMVAVAASCSYLTPLEPSCVMVYGPGRYRFVDFLKVGALLTVVIYVVSILIVPVVWPVQVK